MEIVTNSLTLPGPTPVELVKPSWELASPEIAYPLSLRGRGFLVHMKPYRAYALKVYLRETNLKSAPKSEGKLGLVDPDIYDFNTIKFFMDHFIRFSGLLRRNPTDGTQVELSAEETYNLVHAKFKGIENTVVRDAVGGVRADLAYDDENEVFDLAGTKVRTFQSIYQPALKAVARVDMLHHMANPSETDYRQYRSATEEISVDSRRSTYERLRNYDVLEQLYNHLAQRIDGMTINGATCEEANKDQWADLVPLWHKTLVIGEVFGGVVAKND